MTNLIVIDECKFCDHPRVVSINDDFAMKFSYNQICARNNIDHNKDNIQALNIHFARHFTSPQMAMTRSIVKEKSVELYNAVVETNFSMKQIDILIAKTYQRLERTEDNEEYHKLLKNISDLLKRKNEYLHFHYKISGKSTEDDIMKSSLVAMVKKAGEMVGEQAVNDVKNKNSGKTVIDYIFNDNDHLANIIAKIEEDEKKKQKKYKKDDYEVVNE